MHRFGAAACGLWLVLTALPAAAGDSSGVESMNYPAWLLRDYQTRPLAVGTALNPNDLVRSGEGGRVRVALAGGGKLDLGESSRLVIETPVPDGAAPAARPAALLQLLRGVFRLDTAVRNPALGPVEIRIGAISVRAGDAEFWGRSDAQQDLVCLLRGKLKVQGGGNGTTDLDQALSCYVKPRQSAALPVDRVDAERHRLWIAETALDATAGIAAAGGEWQLVLASFADRAGAERELERLRASGYAVRLKSVLRQGRSLHRLLLPGFISRDAALRARDRARRDLGIADAWVWRAN